MLVELSVTGEPLLLVDVHSVGVFPLGAGREGPYAVEGLLGAHPMGDTKAQLLSHRLPGLMPRC